MKFGGRLIFVIGVALFVFMLASLLIMSDAMQNSERFGRLYLGLLLFNTLGLLTLLVLIGLNIRRLYRQLRERAAGARMTVRIVIMLTALSVTPVLILYYFSLNFLHRGIDSWFDLRVEQALNDSIELSRLALDDRMRDLLRRTKQLADEFSAVHNAAAPFEIDQMRQRIGADELTLLNRQGVFIASSASDATKLVPASPDESILLQVRQGSSYAGLDAIKDSGLAIRIVVNVPELGIQSEGRILQALYPVSDRMNMLAGSVQSAFEKYKELSYLREQLKISFILMLTLVLLFALFSTIWAAFYSATRLVAPIRDLAEGTQAVAGGNYDMQLPVPGRDELGFLVASFNEMTRRIALARDAVRRSQQEAEAQRAYLEAVLSRLSSGVLVLDQQRRLRTANLSASQILGVRLEELHGKSLAELSAGHPHLKQFKDAIEPHTGDPGRGDWRAQITMFGAAGRQVLMCSGTHLPDNVAELSGHVIVFEDVTTLIQSQRDAAWGEAARRLAHEIKNPLTPIQLCAERIRHKYLHNLPPADAEVLDRLTNTIIQQVETMQGMVNAFSEYARAPLLQPRPVNLNRLIEEVIDLYHGLDPKARIETDLDEKLPLLNADPARLRQVLNNLLANAFDASCGAPARLHISTRRTAQGGLEAVELRVRDAGCGIPDDMIGRVFEPYTTSKSKGTGLGLAIVKKIIEEHSGMVWLENNAPEPGATAIIRLPLNLDNQQQAPLAAAKI